MTVTVDMPEDVMQALEFRARQLHLPPQALAANAIEKEMSRLDSETSREGACIRRSYSLNMLVPSVR